MPSYPWTSLERNSKLLWLTMDQLTPPETTWNQSKMLVSYQYTIRRTAEKAPRCVPVSLPLPVLMCSFLMPTPSTT